MRRIYVTGFMATGKSTVGQALARRIGWTFVDLDQLISHRAGQHVSSIFDTEGEAGFRRREKEALRRVSTLNRVVVATGGGVPIDPDNRLLMAHTGRVLHLDCSPDESVGRASRQRTSGGPARPLLEGPDPVTAAYCLLDGRRGAYATLRALPETVTIDTEVLSVTEVVCKAVSDLGLGRSADGQCPVGEDETIRVAVGTRSYNVLIGTRLLGRLATYLEEALEPQPGRAQRRIAVVSDPLVWSLHGPNLARSLDQTGHEWHVHLVPEGEQTKSLPMLDQCYAFMTNHRFDRHDPVVAFGGGVVGDLAGFLAATYLRGVPFIQVPTTLLAQVDSSVGGKVAVNLPAGKNLAGAFYQPRLVVADTDVLHTLSSRDFRQGLAEAIKMAFIEGGAAWKQVTESVAGLQHRRPGALRELVAHAVRAKARVVSADERERGLRKVLNLGHTIGHALEAWQGYGTLAHGDAVALGMVAAAAFAVERKLAAPQLVGLLRQVLTTYGLPVTLRDAGLPVPDPGELRHYVTMDKKARGNRLTVVVPHEPGRVELVDHVEPDEIVSAARVLLEEERFDGPTH